MSNAPRPLPLDGVRVLDLGCGDGSLLAYLMRERNINGYGVEIADAGVLASVRNGVSVLQSDLESGLAGFDDASFDCVILSQTLQAMRNVEGVLREMLRVGREGIVTFPNFGYWGHRLQVCLGGHMPVSRSLPYQWYNTPNVHLFTLLDFEKVPQAHMLSIQYDPGVKVVYVGFAMLCMNLIGVFFFSHQRLWIVVEDGKVSLGGDANRNRLGFEDRLKRIAANIRVLPTRTAK